jgi:hypothetical protein
MTKIKIAIKTAVLILILAAAGTAKLPAPPDPCYYRTMGWSCAQQTTANSHRFYMTYYPGGFTGMSVTRNGVPFGSTTGTELLTPNWSGTYVVTAYNGSCTISFTFVD